MLIDRAREGDLEAYGQLFERHEASARALARQLAKSAGEADDAVSEAFERVLGAIRRGMGPRDSFRPYLLTTIRRTSYDRTRREQRTGPTADEWILDQGVEDPDLSLAAFERDALARAFETLPERWQTVLWHTEVEETAPEDLAEMLGVRPNALAALAYRAREGLRQAYVLAHVDIDLTEPSRDCRWTLERLPKYVRGRVSDDAELKIERHLDACQDCRGLYFEMADLGVSLRAALVPLVFGGPAVLAAVKSVSGGAAASAGAAGLAGLSAGGAASSGVAAAGTGVAAATSGSLVSGVAAATVAATVGGALVLPSVTATIRDDPPPAQVASPFGRTLTGIDEPVVVTTAARRVVVAAPAPTAAPVASTTTEADDEEVVGDVGEGVIVDEDGEVIGNIGSPLIITPPVPSVPDPSEPDTTEAAAPDTSAPDTTAPGAEETPDDAVDGDAPGPDDGSTPVDPPEDSSTSSTESPETPEPSSNEPVGALVIER